MRMHRMAPFARAAAATIAAVAPIVAATVCSPGVLVAHADLGRGEKLRILVDKVMQPQAGWVTEEWMVEAAAEAGFNVFSPRQGGDGLDEVRQVTAWCAEYGIYHMPWMRGTLVAPDGDEAKGKRVVWANGSEQPLWSPNSDEFWTWTNGLIVEYARISVEMPQLIGVFLDYENYWPGGMGNCYGLSYDDIILRRFAEAKGTELPELALEQRAAWLDGQELHDEFRQFQIDHWRGRCRALRRAVDEHNPTFRFCTYPAPGTLFMVEATYPEWATAQAPLILADACTYGRPSRFLPQLEALGANRQKLLRNMEAPKAAGIPFTYAGGIDPVVTGADPEFCGRNAVMISEVTDGYWVFYEGPTYTEQDHADYWKWFTWANGRIAVGDLATWREPRETPEDWSLQVFDGAGYRPGVVAPAVTGATVDLPAVRLRGENLLLLAVSAGQPVEVVLRNRPVGTYRSLLVWDLRDAAMAKLASGTIPHNDVGAVAFTPEADGVYLLGVSAGSCAYSVARSSVPVGLHAGDGLSLIGGADRLYFHVPRTAERFSLTARGSGAETVRVVVFDPAGKQAAVGQTTPERGAVDVAVRAGGHAGQTWSLAVTKADEGFFEDGSVALSPELPPVLSLVPEHIFRAAEE